MECGAHDEAGSSRFNSRVPHRKDPRLWWSADTTDGLSSAAVIDCAEQDAAQEFQLEHFTACICRAFTTVLGAPGDTNSCVSGRSQTLLHFFTLFFSKPRYR